MVVSTRKNKTIDKYLHKFIGGLTFSLAFYFLVFKLVDFFKMIDENSEQIKLISFGLAMFLLLLLIVRFLIRYIVEIRKLTPSKDFFDIIIDLMVCFTVIIMTIRLNKVNELVFELGILYILTTIKYCSLIKKAADKYTAFVFLSKTFLDICLAITYFILAYLLWIFPSNKYDLYALIFITLFQVPYTIFGSLSRMKKSTWYIAFCNSKHVENILSRLWPYYSKGRIEMYLIRHGETQANRENILEGSTDSTLTANGEIQSLSISKFLSKKNVAYLFQSSLLRAKQTATIIQNTVSNLNIETDERFNEIDLGIYEKVKLEHLRTKDPHFYDVIRNDPEKIIAPNGESWDDFRDRVLVAFEQIIQTRRNSTIALVSHEGPIRLIICHLLKLSFRHIWNFLISPGSISLINIDEKNATVQFLNYVPEP
ncbi:MAG: histidine phosphatase family protein [Bacteroidetes bacterium]|nr:MAG: histidine phosphatase family protein [Bacteroidota bacterium]